MLYCVVFCCIVLCCAVLCCAVLCCVVLCCVVLCCAVLCCEKKMRGRRQARSDSGGVWWGYRGRQPHLHLTFPGSAAQSNTNGITSPFRHIKKSPGAICRQRHRLPLFCEFAFEVNTFLSNACYAACLKLLPGTLAQLQPFVPRLLRDVNIVGA